MPIITMCAPIAWARSLGLVEAGAQLGLQLVGGRAGQRARADVDLDVELPELGLEVLVGDRVEDLVVAHRRVLLGVDEVELDLQAGERALEVELRLVEHPGEHVQAAPQLLAVALPVRRGEGSSRHLLAHDGSFLVPLCCEGGTETIAPSRGRTATTGARDGAEVKATERWYSERLRRDIGLARWGHYGTPGAGLPDRRWGRRGDRAQRPARRLLAAARGGADQDLLLRQRRRAGDGREGGLAGAPDVAARPVPPVRRRRGRARHPRRPRRRGGADRRRRRLDRRLQRRGRAVPVSRRCSAPPSR